MDQSSKPQDEKAPRETDWIPSCGGNFFQSTACGKCTTCTVNLKRIKDSTPLGRETERLEARIEKLKEAMLNELKAMGNCCCGADNGDQQIDACYLHEALQADDDLAQGDK